MKRWGTPINGRRLAVPTPDHFIPLLYLAALAAAESSPAQALDRGYAMGSVSMSSYGLGVDFNIGAAAGAADVPADIPPDQTNM